MKWLPFQENFQAIWMAFPFPWKKRRPKFRLIQFCTILRLLVTRVTFFPSYFAAYCICCCCCLLLFTLFEKLLTHWTRNIHFGKKCHITCTFYHLSFCHFGLHSDSISHEFAWIHFFECSTVHVSNTAIIRINFECANINSLKRKKDHFVCVYKFVNSKRFC